jgi:hypothetical protein
MTSYRQTLVAGRLSGLSKVKLDASIRIRAVYR